MLLNSSRRLNNSKLSTQLRLIIRKNRPRVDKITANQSMHREGQPLRALLQSITRDIVEIKKRRKIIIILVDTSKKVQINRTTTILAPKFHSTKQTFRQQRVVRRQAKTDKQEIAFKVV